MTDAIATIEQLEACIGVAGLPVKMKIIDHLDEGAARWIADAPVAFVGAGTADGPSVTIAGGPAGFARARSKSILTVPLDAMDDVSALAVGQGAGTLFLVPGIGETLRVNGRVAAVTEAALEIAVEECFIHCAKALIRSDFWAAQPAQAPADATALLNAARFLALVTMDETGRIDISPKGDPAGLLMKADEDSVTLAERPGNRLAFGYRNIIASSRVAAVAVVPGAATVATFTGRAHLSADEVRRASFTVDGKIPILATVIEDVAAATAPSGALERAGLWGRPHANPAIDPSAVLVAHVKLNKTRGEQAMAIRAATGRAIVAKGLEHAYTHTLY